MTQLDITQESFIHSIVDLCEKAGAATLEVYESDSAIEVENKQDDSPLTEADKRSNAILVEGLQALYPSIPIISEELEIPSYEQRQSWPMYWLIDPLDGTKEFIQRSGEFTVNVALIKNNEAVFGVVTAPVLKTSYYGALGIGARKILNGEEKVIQVRSLSQQIDSGKKIKVVASKRHGNEKVAHFLENIEQRLAKFDTENIGSSLKICLLAEGTADFYPRLAPTCEWDIAAAHAVLKAAGGEIYNEDGSVFTYNTKTELLNTDFFAVADGSYHWPEIITSSLETLS